MVYFLKLNALIGVCLNVQQHLIIKSSAVFSDNNFHSLLFGLFSLQRNDGGSDVPVRSTAYGKLLRHDPDRQEKDHLVVPAPPPSLAGVQRITLNNLRHG